MSPHRNPFSIFDSSIQFTPESLGGNVPENFYNSFNGFRNYRMGDTFFDSYYQHPFLQDIVYRTYKINSASQVTIRTYRHFTLSHYYLLIGFFPYDIHFPVRTINPEQNSIINVDNISILDLDIIINEFRTPVYNVISGVIGREAPPEDEDDDVNENGNVSDETMALPNLPAQTPPPPQQKL